MSAPFPPGGGPPHFSQTRAQVSRGSPPCLSGPQHPLTPDGHSAVTSLVSRCRCVAFQVAKPHPCSLLPASPGPGAPDSRVLRQAGGSGLRHPWNGQGPEFLRRQGTVRMGRSQTVALGPPPQTGSAGQGERLTHRCSWGTRGKEGRLQAKGPGRSACCLLQLREQFAF